VGQAPQRFDKGRYLAQTIGRSATSRSHPTWPLRYSPFFRVIRWNCTGYIPPLFGSEFELDVLNRHGPAQVGFDVFMITSFTSHRLMD